MMLNTDNTGATYLPIKDQSANIIQILKEENS